MTRDVVLNMNEFGRHALDTFVQERSGSPSAAARTASLYYLADRDSERPAWTVPRFPPGSRQQDGDGATRITLDDGTWEAVVEEAGRQSVTAEELLAHAIVYFLADLDSGRVAARLDETL